MQKLTHYGTQVAGIDRVSSITCVSTIKRVVPFMSNGGACGNIDNGLIIGSHKGVNTTIALSDAYEY